MDSKYVSLLIEEGKATILLNRPERHNMLGVEELGALDAAIDEIEGRSDIRVLVLTGSGPRTFCSGFDLNQITSTDWTNDPFQRTVTRLEHLAIPTICALNGSVYGGGTELALACDFRIGVLGMRLHLPAAEIGVHYSINGLRRFCARLGLQPAKRILLSAERIEDRELLALGYLDRLVGPAELMTHTNAMADRFAALAPLAVRGMKRSLNQIAYGTLDAAAAAQAISECFASADLSEGLTAKREKRAPRFTGR